jgi:hypothetical protein
MVTRRIHPFFLMILLLLLAGAGAGWTGTAMAGVRGDKTPASRAPSDNVIRCFTPFLTGQDPSPDMSSEFEQQPDADLHQHLHPDFRLFQDTPPRLQPGAYQNFHALSTRPSIPDDATPPSHLPRDQQIAVAQIAADTIEVHTYESESGRFRLLYTTEGPDSVWSNETGIGEPGVPDYIILAAQFADSSFRYQVEQLGFIDPLNSTLCDSATGPQLDIVFGDIRDTNGRKVYGYFDPKFPSRFYVNSTFSDPAFQRNDDDDKILGALKVTIAHELKHAVQFATNCFSGNEINIHWLEMDATMMENVVFPNVNDYYNYIGGSAGIFGNPQTRFPRAYSHVTFMLYYHEDFGPGFWVDVWDEIGEEYLSGRNIPMLEAMERVIERYRGGQIAGMHETGDAHGIRDAHGAVKAHGTGSVFAKADINGTAGAAKPASGDVLPDLEQSLLRNYLWHLASGNRSLFSYGFSERENYPTAHVAGSYSAIPDWPGAPVTVQYHSARFFEFQADQMDAAGDVALALFNSDRPLGIGFLGKAYNGEVFEFLVRAGGEKRQKLTFPVEWRHLDWLGLVAMNTTGGAPVNAMQMLAGEGPAIERIPYGNITRSGALSLEDAGWMLSRVLNPAAISTFDLFLADVSGNGTVTTHDASLVLKNLENGAPFPQDDNLDDLGPEWSRFETVGNDNAPVSSPLWNKASSLTTNSERSKIAPPDTVTAELVLLEDQVLAEQKMDILLRVTGTPEHPADQAPAWSSLLLELEIDFPPDDGGMGPGDPISLELTDLLPGNMEPQLRIWDHDDQTDLLRIVFASSGAMATDFDPTGLLTLRIMPLNEGYIHFRIRELRVDEYEYALNHSVMDTIRVMGPVYAERPGDTRPEQPLAFSLEQNYPNPFNPVTTIRFTLPEAGQATLSVYDITGRRVATLVDGFLERGDHHVLFDAHEAQNVSSGVYLYRLATSSGGKQTRKMTVLK